MFKFCLLFSVSFHAARLCLVLMILARLTLESIATWEQTHSGTTVTEL